MMETYFVEIIESKAIKILKDMEDTGLIAIVKTDSKGLQKITDKIRDKAAKSPLSLDKITEEVEIVRSKRYAKKK